MSLITERFLMGRKESNTTKNIKCGLILRECLFVKFHNAN